MMLINSHKLLPLFFFFLLLLVRFQTTTTTTTIALLGSSSSKEEKTSSVCVNHDNSNDDDHHECISPGTTASNSDKDSLNDDGDDDRSSSSITCDDINTASTSTAYDYVEGTGIVQETGEGKIPANIVQQVKQTICEGNQYYNNLLSSNKYRLTISNCINKQSMCSYWKVRGQCTSPQYQNYMTSECPLACQLCHSDEIGRAKAFINFLFHNMTAAYNNRQQKQKRDDTITGISIVKKRRRALILLMKTIDMDPTLLERPLLLPNNNKDDDGNWFLTLHERLMALIPSILLRIYYNDDDDDKNNNPPSMMIINNSKEEAQILAKIHDGLDSSSSQKQIPMIWYRKRGQILTLLAESMDTFIIRPIQLNIGFAIPNEAAITAIQSLNIPVIEFGSGTGYWSALLKQNSDPAISIKSYDINVPGSSNQNAFFDTWYASDIQQGSCIDILTASTSATETATSQEEDKSSNKTTSSSSLSIAQSHALLLVWPNDPDPIDNPQFCDDDDDSDESSPSSQPVWDVDCLKAYLEGGGSYVIYVGERQIRIQEKYGPASAATDDSGISSTRAFQNLLLEKFDLQQTITIPTMWLNEDDMTIWKRKPKETQTKPNEQNIRL